MNCYPVILAGGTGSRLRPVSREFYPKPPLHVFGANSLLQDTATQFDDIGAVVKCLVGRNEEHRFLLAEQVRKLGREWEAIIPEPQGCDTAPALTIAALDLVSRDPDAMMAIMPADHMIPEQAAFSATMEQGTALAGKSYLVTYGVESDKLETGCACICSGGEVEGSGVFRTAMAGRKQDSDFLRVDHNACVVRPSEAIDHAVRENTDKAAVIPLRTAWSDVGSRSAVWEISERDAAENAARGDGFVHDSRNSLLLADKGYFAAVGLEDVIVVETADAVLVADKSCCQGLKAVKAGQGQEYRSHSRLYHPRGDYERTDLGTFYRVKCLRVKPGAALYLQIHHHRAEHWVVVSGTARGTRGEDQFSLSENESTYIPVGTQRRLENPETSPLEIIEVQSGTYLGGDDMVRFEDNYSRVPS